MDEATRPQAAGAAASVSSTKGRGREGVRHSATSIGHSSPSTTPRRSAPSGISSPSQKPGAPPSIRSAALSTPSTVAAVSPPTTSSTLRQRKAAGSQPKQSSSHSSSSSPNAASSTAKAVGAQVDGQDERDMPTLESTAPHPKWVLFALLSGAFAAMNGVFAKLTTSENTVSLASSISHLLPFLDASVLTLLLRAIFFGLNLGSNAIMWVLFTRALTSHPSTTKVSVVNTSANFTITAIMGALVFGEAVGGVGGVVGLALLVAGCVVLGAKKEEGEGALVLGGDDDGDDAVTVVDTESLLRPDGGAPYVAKDVDELIDLRTDLEATADERAILEGNESEGELED